MATIVSCISAIFASSIGRATPGCRRLFTSCTRACSQNQLTRVGQVAVERLVTAALDWNP